MQRNTPNKCLLYLDLVVEHFAGGKAAAPNHAGFLRTAVLSFLLAGMLLVLLIWDEIRLSQTRLGLDFPLLVITLILSAAALVCGVRSTQRLHKNRDNS